MPNDKSVVCNNCKASYQDITVFPLRCGCGESISPDGEPVRGSGSPPAAARHLPKPGTQLAQMVPDMLKREGCGCDEYAAKMDRWGVAGCREHFDEIVEHLVEQSKERRITSLAGERVCRAVAVRWVTQAIEKAETTLADRLDVNGEWFVAVTTSPRRDCTLRASVESIRAAGWEPVVFAEPGSSKTDAVTVWNDHQKGVWYNWLHSCRYALDNSSASVILTVQDDSEFHPDSRRFAESILWPADDAGFVSLYTPKHYTLQPRKRTAMRPPGVNRVYTRSLWGACALAFPRAVLEEAIETDIAKTWLGAPPRSGNRNVYKTRKENPHMVANSDTAIGKIMRQMERSLWFVDPSPVRHIAQFSTLSSHGGNTGRRNCIRCADHEKPLADQVTVDFEVKEVR